MVNLLFKIMKTIIILILIVFKTIIKYREKPRNLKLILYQISHVLAVKTQLKEFVVLK